MVLAGGQWIFIVALLPSVFGKDKPALSTSLLTGAVLSLFAFTFTTLSLWVSAVSTELSSLTWFLLALQKYRAGKNRA